MRQYFDKGPQISFGPGPITPAVKGLLYANAGVFILMWLVDVVPWIDLFGLDPTAILGKLHVWQVATYMFLHGSFWHLFFNMFGLWIFGVQLERHWGTDFFLQYYFVVGVGAGIITWLFMWGQPVQTIGASGAIMGILVAFGVTWPNKPILFAFLFPIPAKIFVAIFGILELMAARDASDNVNHITHLAGLAIGFLYLRADWRPQALIAKFRGRMRRRHLKVVRSEPRVEPEVDEAEIDAILDKISREGLPSLTETEVKKLRKRSRN